MKFRAFVLLASLVAAAFIPAACQSPDENSSQARAMQPLPAAIQKKMAAMNMPLNSPIMIRLFKEDSALEVWKQETNGRFGLIAQYQICKWSGKLGPKYMEGDRQAPEGYYTITRAQMNPNSHYYLSFNIGFPNAYDQAHGRTGRNLMVHGSCSSAGCYSMTDKNIAQIYAFARDAFMGGQRSFQVEAFPFRMTAENMARYRKDPNYPFWAMLKKGYDSFEKTHIPPKVDVCNGRYVFNSPNGCASSVALQTAFADSDAADLARTSGIFSSLKLSHPKPPSPSIINRQEAALVADWSKRRAAGQAVSAEPPSLTPASAEKPNAPDIVTRQMQQVRMMKVNGKVQPVAVVYSVPANSSIVAKDEAHVKAARNAALGLGEEPVSVAAVVPQPKPQTGSAADAQPAQAHVNTQLDDELRLHPQPQMNTNDSAGFIPALQSKALADFSSM